MGVKSFNPERVYPVTKPDNFGQVKESDKDHSRLGTPNSDEAHFRSDLDSSVLAQHHTLGTGRNQASPGSHVHDGISSPKLGLYQMDNVTGVVTTSLVLTGAKGGNVALTNLITMLKNFIDFTDSTT